MIAHHVKETYLHKDEDFLVSSFFIFFIALLVVVVASVFIITTVARTIYNVDFRTYSVTFSVPPLFIDTPHHLFVEPISHIIIDSGIPFPKNVLLSAKDKPLLGRSSQKPIIHTIEGFNRQFSKAVMDLQGESQKKNFIFLHQEGLYFSSQMFFKKNSDKLTSEGEIFLKNIKNIFKTFDTYTDSNLKWNVQINGYLDNTTVKISKNSPDAIVPIAQKIVFMTYLQNNIMMDKNIVLHISKNTDKPNVGNLPSHEIIGLKIIPQD